MDPQCGHDALSGALCYELTCWLASEAAAEKDYGLGEEEEDEEEAGQEED